MPIAHECKCGLVTPVPETQGGKRLRCMGCGTIAVVVVPEALAPDPVPVAAGAAPPADTAPAPPPPRAHRYRRKLTPQEERADYPRTGGVIDWRRVHEGDEYDYHRDPHPPDPQTRYLQPEMNVTGRLVGVAVGGLMILAAAAWLGFGLAVFGRVPYIAVAASVGLFVGGCGFLVRSFFGRRN